MNITIRVAQSQALKLKATSKTWTHGAEVAVRSYLASLPETVDEIRSSSLSWKEVVLLQGMFMFKKETMSRNMLLAAIDDRDKIEDIFKRFGVERALISSSIAELTAFQLQVLQEILLQFWKDNNKLPVPIIRERMMDLAQDLGSKDE